MTSGSRLGSILLFALIIARIVRTGEMRTLSILILTMIAVSFFDGELLDPLGVPGSWFLFGIGVSRTQYLYAIAIPLLAAPDRRNVVAKERVKDRAGDAQQDGGGILQQRASAHRGASRTTGSN